MRRERTRYLSNSPQSATRSGGARAPWGHISRRCVYCGKVGPRVVVAQGYAHRRCIPKNGRTTTRTRTPEATQ